MNKKLVWTVALIVVVVLIIVVSQSSSRSSTASIKIGAIAPLTGWGAYWAEGYQKGISMAVEELNQNGTKVDVIIEDGATAGPKSATAAQKLINIDKVNGLIVEFTAPASSASPIAQQSKTPLMYDAVTKKIAAANPQAFKMYFDMEQQCYVSAKNLALSGAKHIGGLIMNLDFASECQSAMDKVSKETGVKVSYYPFETNTTDFRTFILKMKSDGIDSIVPVLFEDNAIAFFKQKSDLKFNVPMFLGLGVPDSFSIKVRSSVATSSLEGIMTYDQAISADFKNRLIKKYPGTTEKDYLSAAYGYDETMRLYRALEGCSRGDTDCVTVKLKSDDYTGALMAKGFTEDRVINIDPVYYRYTKGQLVEFSPVK